MTNKEGWALAEAGAQQAADASGPDWQDRAMEVFDRFIVDLEVEIASRVMNHPSVDLHRMVTFTSEDIRNYAENSGLPQPPDPRAWGQILLTASKEGRIVKAGYTTSKNRHAHCRPIAQWCLP